MTGNVIKYLKNNKKDYTMKTTKLFLTAVSVALLFTACDKMPTIDKEYNPGVINKAASSVSMEETFRQGDELTSSKIILSYENGLGREAEVLVPEVNGIYSDPVKVTLASRNSENNGNGTVEITLQGAPLTKDKTKLRPTIRFATHEVFVEYEVTPKADIILNAASSAASGTFKIFKPVQNGKLSVNYNSTKPHTVTIGVAEVIGIAGAEFTTTLPAAPGGGTIDIPLEGTPSDHGSTSYVVRMVKGDTEYTMTKAIDIAGEVAFDIAGSSVVGDITGGDPLSGVKIILKYTADRAMNMTVSVPAVNGISAAAYQATLSAGTNTIEIPLVGTPADSDDKTLVVRMEENNIIYTATIVAKGKPGEPFEEETITFNGLTYKTVFVDLNGNGFVNKGEVWLDRNIGATSNDPGTYGEGNGNAASFGHYYQFGVAYGSAFQNPYTIDITAMSPWNICPDGYTVPTDEQFAMAMAALVPGSTRNGRNVSGTAGITETIMNSVLKLPMVGALVSDVPQNVGIRGYYWTSSAGSNSAPWRIELNLNTATSTGSNWSGWNWQHPVRCIKK